MSQPAKNSKLQKKKESTLLDTLFLIIALREHAVSTFRPFRPFRGWRASGVRVLLCRT